MKMKINGDLLRQIESDLSINSPYVKGKDNPIKNCWHFYTDGSAVDRLFEDKEDFKDGMNRVFAVVAKYNIIILAFCLMDTHIHFIIYGNFNECNKFIHDYTRITSIRIFNRYKERHKLLRIPINHQVIDSEFYLKSAICYVIKNPPVGGLSSTAYDYPWGSGGLYFRGKGEWSSPNWISVKSFITGNSSAADRLDIVTQKTSVSIPIFAVSTFGRLAINEKRNLLKSKSIDFPENTLIINGVIFPGEYVAYQIVEKIFRTHRSFNFFMCKTKEEDIEKNGGVLSRLSIPMQELRQHRDEICKELFSSTGFRKLTMQQRLKLARVIKSRFNSSSKQICRVCGLIYPEVRELL